MKQMVKPIGTKTFTEIVEEAEKCYEEKRNFIERTGLCPICKKNPVKAGEMRCKECREDTEAILAELRKDPGFTEIKMRG